jgi:hypothetical protein
MVRFSNPKLSALIFGFFWSGWTILCVRGILSYYRECLIISEETITKFCVFRKKVIAIENVLYIKWPRQGRLEAILLESPFAKIRIYLSEYTKSERDEIIHSLRTTVAADLQQNWSEFQETCQRKQVRVPPTPTTAKELMITAFILLSLSGCFFYYWWIEIGIKNFVIGVITSLIAIWFLTRIRYLSGNTQGNQQ